MLDLDYVSRLDGAPVTKLETLVPLSEDELLNGLAVDLGGRILQVLVMDQVEAARGYDTGDGDEDDMGVVGGGSLPGDRLGHEMHEQDQMVKGE